MKDTIGLYTMITNPTPVPAPASLILFGAGVIEWMLHA
jgi:hypothetical protein